MFESGMYEYGLKTGDLSEQEIIKIIKKANSKIAKEINDSRIPKGLNMIKSTGPFVVALHRMRSHRNMTIYIVLDIETALSV